MWNYIENILHYRVHPFCNVQNRARTHAVLCCYFHAELFHYIESGCIHLSLMHISYRNCSGSVILLFHINILYLIRSSVLYICFCLFGGGDSSYLNITHPYHIQ
jgi:hypothetical protein